MRLREKNKHFQLDGNHTERNRISPIRIGVSAKPNLHINFWKWTNIRVVNGFVENNRICCKEHDKVANSLTEKHLY